MGSWHPFPSGGRGSFNLDTLKGSRERGAGFLSLGSGQHLIYSPADTRRQLASSCTHSCRSSPRAWALPPRWPLGSPRADDRTGKLPPPGAPSFLVPCVLPGFTASCAASCPGRELSGTVHLQTPNPAPVAWQRAPACSQLLPGAAGLWGRNRTWPWPLLQTHGRCLRE